MSSSFTKIIIPAIYSEMDEDEDGEEIGNLIFS